VTSTAYEIRARPAAATAETGLWAVGTQNAGAINVSGVTHAL
jgi:hypothetical protein